MADSKITKWIRHRAASGQALNLHAVARERPDIIEHVFAPPSPIGWRRSLIHAGVDPYNIAHEHENLVECAICGYAGAVLGVHLKQLHGMTSDEYREEYGAHCEVSSESYRLAKFRASAIMDIPHWERLWSSHYVIDWIIRLHEEGHDLNFNSIQLTGKPLAQRGWRLFGKWDAALIAAGFNPEEERVRPPHQQWDHPMLVTRLRAFAAKRRKNRGLKMPNDLRMAANHLCGTLEAAAHAAEVDPDDISIRYLFKSQKVDALVAEIRNLEPLKGRERRQKLAEIYHGNGENKRIVQHHFLSLARLAQTCGIDPKAVSPATYRDADDVHHDLDLIKTSGKPLCFDTLRHGYKRLYNVIKETGWGNERLQRDAGN